MTDKKLPKNAGWSFVEYFNKNKPVYTQNDVESFLKLEMAEALTTIIERVEGMKKKRQIPLNEKVMDRVYDCDVAAYNQALDDALALLKAKLGDL